MQLMIADMQEATIRMIPVMLLMIVDMHEANTMKL